MSQSVLCHPSITMYTITFRFAESDGKSTVRESRGFIVLQSQNRHLLVIAVITLGKVNRRNGKVHTPKGKTLSQGFVRFRHDTIRISRDPHTFARTLVTMSVAVTSSLISGQTRL